MHALVRVDAKTKTHWDQIVKGTVDHEGRRISEGLQPGLRWLITNGLDKGVLSAVRLTRLPGCYRHGKVGKRYERPQLQKLLYLNPEASPMHPRPICEMFAKRDVVAYWKGLALQGIADSDDTGGAWIWRGLKYYAGVNKEIREAAMELKRKVNDA